MTVIKLSSRSRKPNSKIDPFFAVDSIPLVRKDTQELVGVHGLFNHSNGKKLSTVSDEYTVVTHKEASDLVKNLLNETGVPYESNGPEVAIGGARFFETIVFPSLKVNLADDNSTALDAGTTLAKEDIFPAITIRNSYDKTAPVSWSYAIYRLVCGNGASVITQEEKFSYKHNQIIDLDRVKARLMTRLDQSVESMIRAYTSLNSTKGIKVLNTLIESRGFSDKFKSNMINILGSGITMDQKIIKDEVTGRTSMEISNIKTPLSAWAIYNVATDVASHQLPSRTEREVAGNRIAQVFGIGA
jgi:hypothetical protein